MKITTPGAARPSAGLGKLTLLTVLTLVLALGATGGAAPSAAAASGDPVVSGPIMGGTHGHPWLSYATRPSPVNVAGAGYTEAEYFIAGTAAAYQATVTMGTDGRWRVAPATTAPYRTRILVERPANPRRFNGTVVVEWLNVTADLDLAPDFAYAHQELLRDGFAWVGVSAQQVGVTGAPFGLTSWDPARYGSLTHPGDSFSYDMFTQAGRAIRHPIGVNPLAGLRVRKVLADGESQSAFRLVTYVDAVQPIAHVFDGFLIHSRGVSSAPLSQAPQPFAPAPPIVHIRTDLNVPVLQFETETDLRTLGYRLARQSDTAMLRTWEAAGTAHADQFFTDNSDPVVNRDRPGFPPPACDKPFNNGQEHQLMNTAIRDLRWWVVFHTAPPRSARISLTADAAIARDSFGNALGGIRTPAVDVPVATESGEGNSPPGFCDLFGSRAALSAATLQSLYPSPLVFVLKTWFAAQRAVAAGFLDRRDAAAIVNAALAGPGG